MQMHFVAVSVLTKYGYLIIYPLHSPPPPMTCGLAVPAARARRQAESRQAAESLAWAGWEWAEEVSSSSYKTLGLPGAALAFTST